jgi:hypothetical protein
MDIHLVLGGGADPQALPADLTVGDLLAHGGETPAAGEFVDDD